MTLWWRPIRWRNLNVHWSLFVTNDEISPGPHSTAITIRHCSQLPSVLLWTSSILQRADPWARIITELLRPASRTTWQLETEDWSSKAILAQNCGGWPATNESWTGDCEATCLTDRLGGNSWQRQRHLRHAAEEEDRCVVYLIYQNNGEHRCVLGSAFCTTKSPKAYSVHFSQLTRHRHCAQAAMLARNLTGRFSFSLKSRKRNYSIAYRTNLLLSFACFPVYK